MAVPGLAADPVHEGGVRPLLQVAVAARTSSSTMDFIPWPSFYERVAASLTSGEQKYQMIVTDSQWLGAFVEGGYYKDLTERDEERSRADRRS